MNWFKKKQPQYVYTWESEPYIFQKGMIYVIEWDVNKVTMEEANKLSIFFREQGVIVKLVPTRDGQAFNPVQVKRKKEQV